MQNQNTASIKVLQIIWFVLFAWTGALIFLAHKSSQAVEAVAGDYAQIKLIFTVIAVVAFVVAMILPKMICAGSLRQLPTQKTMPQMILATFTGWVVQFALFESICLFGFILAFSMTKNFNDMLPFIALSYLGFVLRFPTEDKVEKMCTT